MKSIGGKAAGESQVEKSLGLDKKQNGGTHVSFILVYPGQLIMNIYSMYAGNKVTMRSSVVSHCSA